MPIDTLYDRDLKHIWIKSIIVIKKFVYNKTNILLCVNLILGISGLNRHEIRVQLTNVDS